MCLIVSRSHFKIPGACPPIFKLISFADVLLCFITHCEMFSDSHEMSTFYANSSSRLEIPACRRRTFDNLDCGLFPSPAKALLITSSLLLVAPYHLVWPIGDDSSVMISHNILFFLNHRFWINRSIPIAFWPFFIRPLNLHQRILVRCRWKNPRPGAFLTKTSGRFKRAPWRSRGGSGRGSSERCTRDFGTWPHRWPSRHWDRVPWTQMTFWQRLRSWRIWDTRSWSSCMPSAPKTSPYT